MEKKDNLQNWLQYQKLLREASLSNNEFMKKQAIDQINRNSPDVANEVSREWYRRYSREELISRRSVFELTSIGTDMNVELYLWIINNRINQYYNWSVSSTAIQKIFFQSQPLSQDYVLYTKDEKELTVSDFLSV